MNYRELCFYVLLSFAIVWDVLFVVLIFAGKMSLQWAFLSSLFVTVISVVYGKWVEDMQ